MEKATNEEKYDIGEKSFGFSYLLPSEHTLFSDSGCNGPRGVLSASLLEGDKENLGSPPMSCRVVLRRRGAGGRAPRHCLRTGSAAGQRFGKSCCGSLRQVLFGHQKWAECGFARPCWWKSLSVSFVTVVFLKIFYL